jgi:hypothetical protein
MAPPIRSEPRLVDRFACPRLMRSIPFRHLESIDVTISRDPEAPALERAKIRADDGQSITLDSSMPGYRPVLELLRTHAARKAGRDLLADPEFASSARGSDNFAAQSTPPANLMQTT